MDPQEATLLVVDDNELNRDMLSRRLGRRGYDVLVAEDGREALETVAERRREGTPLDLVLLDIMMPGIDGVEVLRRLRQDHSQGELPVIMVTAKAESDAMVEALDLGANDYVTKPIDFPVVLARVQSALRTRESAATATRGNGAREPTVADLAPGAVIAGKYRLDDKIGSGNFGAVYQARHIELDHDVAVKVLQPSVTADDESLTRFRREGVAACRVRHPNAVAVTDFGVTETGVAYLVMELLSGSTLVAELQQYGRLSAERCLEIVGPICDVLAEAHAAGLVHRDIKPENIFLDRSGKAEVVKVLDFGIAKLVGETITQQNLTAEGWVLGTPAYMAPERLSSTRDYDGGADVYSLGVMLFEMLVGRRPYVLKGDPMKLIMAHAQRTPPTLRSIDPTVPAELEEVVSQAMSKEPRDRPEAADLRRRLAAAIERIGPERLRAAAAAAGRPRTDSGPIDPTAPTTALNTVPETWTGRLRAWWRRLFDRS